MHINFLVEFRREFGRLQKPRVHAGSHDRPNWFGEEERELGVVIDQKKSVRGEKVTSLKVVEVHAMSFSDVHGPAWTAREPEVPPSQVRSELVTGTLKPRSLLDLAGEGAGAL